ncbi:hypothetical protein [Pseudogemmobacter bohemicus]|uniref:hypothetical protein n=1 Tax=Pseudogemmobacter bohemicus TaxID=2250708 RepID=UPI001300715F|nr:hypothetical protein [Pseudogemmobacter bohemicus]
MTEQTRRTAPLARLARAVAADIGRAQNGMTELSAALQGQFNPPLNTGLNPAEWRAQHRSGHPPRIDADPELRAFILDRIGSQTYDQIVSAVRATFPAERWVSRSSISRWWRRFNRAAPYTSTG